MNYQNIGYSSISLPNGNILFICGQNKILRNEGSKFVNLIEEFDINTKTFNFFDSSNIFYATPKLSLDKNNLILIQPNKNKINIYNYLTKK